MDIVLDTCLSPVKVYNSLTNSYDSFPCGHCINCHRSKQSSWRNRLTTELLCSDRHALFITLTYSNEHLPLVTVDPSTLEVVDITHTRFNRDSTFERVSLFDKFKSENLIDDLPFYRDSELGFTELPSDFPHYVVSRRLNSPIVFDTSNTFAVALKKDVQDFVRRLRTNLSRCSSLCGKDLSFSYFICSEYGPTTFRPHYHGILFFNDYTVSEYAHTCCIYDSWQKCALSDDPEYAVSQRITSNKGVSDYVSKYVTCDSSVPSLLRYEPFNSFHLSSKKNPIGSSAFKINDVPTMFDKGTTFRVQSYFDKDTHEFVTNNIEFPRSSWSRVFPKFLCSKLLSFRQFSALFRRISYFAEHPDEPIPDYRPYLSSFYGLDCINPLRNEPYYRSVTRHTYEPYFNPATGVAFVQEKVESIWRHLTGSISSDTPLYFSHDYVTPNSNYKITSSDVILRILDSPYFVDLYLFGFDQNRCAFRKILSNMRTYDWCRDYEYYLGLYNRFSVIQFSKRLKTVFEYAHSALSTTSQEWTPELVREIYPSFVDSFPEDIELIDSHPFDLDFLLESSFGLSISEFYDDSGKRIPLNFLFGIQRRGSYYEDTVLKSRIHKHKRKCNHDRTLSL